MTGQLDLPLDPPADLTERLRRSGLPASIEVLLHTNRRVMISMPSPGTLRLHRGYTFAPDDVVEALARWASRRRITRPERRALVQRFLAFPVHDFVRLVSHAGVGAGHSGRATRRAWFGSRCCIGH